MQMQPTVSEELAALSGPELAAAAVETSLAYEARVLCVALQHARWKLRMNQERFLEALGLAKSSYYRLREGKVKHAGRLEVVWLRLAALMGER